MSESAHPRFPDRRTASTDPVDPTVPAAGQQWPSDALPDLEHDREVPSRLQGSPQLNCDVKSYLVDALLKWALGGRGYPQMALPDAGPECDHLQALRQIMERIPQRIAEAQTVADKLEFGRSGRMLSRTLWAAWDPQGGRDAIDRELITSMPWLAGPTAPYELPDGWPDVTGQDQHIDDLAGAVVDLLTDTSVRTSPLTGAAATLACLDMVVVQPRQLVGSVADMPPVAQARPLQMFDVLNRPAQALQQALTELPRGSQLGAADASTYLEKGLPLYEQRWRNAARAAVGLEGYLEALGPVPDQAVLVGDARPGRPGRGDPDPGPRPGRGVLPWLKGGQDLAVPYAMLTHPGHDVVRVCSTEIRSRVPAVPPFTTPAPLIRAVLGAAGELHEAMDRYVRAVLDRGADLSMGDLRAVTRLLQFGGTDAAVVLERTHRAVPGADVTAAALRQVAPLAEQLRESPAKTLGQERLDVLRGSSELLARMHALAIQERAMPDEASDTALRRLAAPALEFARHVPNLAKALELGVRDASAGGLMLVPSAADNSNTSNLLWVPNRGTALVQRHVSAVARAAESVASGVRTASAALSEHQARVVDPARQAAARARSHAGPARAQLREVLGQQAASIPPPLSAPLPAHPFGS